MQIECPHCQKSNGFLEDQDVVCGKCKKSLRGFSYRQIKKPLMKASTAALVFGVIGYRVGDIDANHHRYPLAVEYQLVQLCVNPYKTPIAHDVYGRKQDICLCAIDKATREIKYSALKDELGKFKQLVEKEAKNSCGM
ncbi:hypothetical protein ACRTDR_04410 [Shewanella algae]